jgi:predicted Rossmann fold flavoprotein
VCPFERDRSPSTAAVCTVDLAVIGAGAAGLAAAIFAAHHSPGLRVRLVEGARHLGAKILVSGGSRCNVTNRIVTERDFWGGSSAIVRRVLRAFPAERAAEFFAQLGVALHEEEDGKLFPDTNRSRTVLDALLAATTASGVIIDSERRVSDVSRDGDRFAITTPDCRYVARRVVLATGGRSLPKTGSDGLGFVIAQKLGHGCVDTTPALVPLILADGRHAALSGVTHPVALTLRVQGRSSVRIEGSLLWTHFGASGPAVLNLSRHWHRARLESANGVVVVNVCPGDTFETLEEWFLSQERTRPRAQVSTVLATRVPAAVAAQWIGAAGIPAEITLAHLPREDRRRLIRALLELPLEVIDSRGYNYAEVTAGGIPLDEIDPATLESRICPGLHFAGEILDVDGRLGGFNFQWAWASGWVAGRAAAALLAPSTARRSGDSQYGASD